MTDIVKAEMFLLWWQRCKALMDTRHETLRLDYDGMTYTARLMVGGDETASMNGYGDTEWQALADLWNQA